MSKNVKVCPTTLTSIHHQKVMIDDVVCAKVDQNFLLLWRFVYVCMCVCVCVLVCACVSVCVCVDKD